MGTFQSAINNILGASAVAATTVKASIDKKAANEAQALEAKKKEAEAEQKEIKEASDKMSDARLMAVGYSEDELQKKKASSALGLEDSKLPKHIKQKTFDRRMANAIAMEEIHNKYVQDKEFRDKIANLKPQDIAKAIKPEINKSKKGGNK